LQFSLENDKKRTFLYKVAGKKFSWSGQRGGASHRGPPPKYATESNGHVSDSVTWPKLHLGVWDVIGQQ